MFLLTTYERMKLARPGFLIEEITESASLCAAQRRPSSVQVRVDSTRSGKPMCAELRLKAFRRERGFRGNLQNDILEGDVVELSRS